MSVSKTDIVTEVKTILDDEFQTVKSVRDVVSRVGGNYHSCRARFWRETGCSMQEYLINTKLDRAKELLTNQETLIKQVALRLGYNDEAAFIRQFKKYCGTTPGEFQNNQNNMD